MRINAWHISSFLISTIVVIPLITVFTSFFDNTSNYYEGLMDEFHLHNSARSSAWAKASYNSLFDSLVSYGSEESPVSTISLSADFYIMGRPILVSPSDNSKSKTSPMTFTWKIPEDVSNRNVHSEIQVARDKNFTDIEKDLQSWTDSGFEYYNGTEWVKYPAEGVSSAYYGNPARITIPLTQGLKYWRVRGGVYQ